MKVLRVIVVVIALVASGLPNTRACALQRLESVLPLCETPILETSPFWRKYIRSHKEVFLQEYDAFASEYTASLARDNIGAYASTIDTHEKWTSIVLRLFDQDTEFAQLFPTTMRVLSRAGVHIPSIIFSTLAPGAVLKPHRGVTKSVLRYHLGLRVPRDFRNCYISLWDESGREYRHSWECGKDVVFDDNYLHGVQNHTEEPRTVLFLDVRRPYQDAEQQRIRDRLLRIGHDMVRRDEVPKINALYSNLNR